MNDREEHYQRNLRVAAIVALTVVIFVFQIFPRMSWKKETPKVIVIASLHIENIPVTRQGTRKPPPPKPAVPIPSDDELIPEDVTIEKTELDLNLYSPIEGEDGPPGAPIVYQPRPIFEVIPEYPQELQKKGIQGIVKLHIHINKQGLVDQVVVIENTTGSLLCSRSAKNAAMQGRYMPAKSRGKPTDIWITRTYSFGISK